MRKLLFLFVSALLPWLSVRSQKPVYKDAGQPVETRVKDLLNRMTLHEKVLQLNQYTFGENDNPNNIGTEVKNLPAEIGSLIYLHTDPKLRNRIQRKAMEESRLGIPILFGFDVIHGLRTVYPISLAQACSFNPDLVTQACGMAAKESVLSGIDWTFSPMIDVARDPRWGRISECYGEDPFLVGELGKRMIKGLQQEGLVATPKHFAVYSIPVGGRDAGTRTDPHVAPREMRTLYIEPFRKAFCEAGALGVMSSYNDYDGEPITGSYHFLTEILRHEWGFKGYVVSDSEAVEFLYSKHQVAADAVDGAAQVVNAGLNVRTNFTLPENFIRPLRQAISEGKVSMQTIDSRVADVLRVKFGMGLFDNPYKGDAKHPEKVVHSKEHQAVSMRAALESIVLLKNENNILPLSKDLKKVAVIGPNANEVQNLICRYGPANAPIKTVYQGIKEYLPDAEVRYAKGTDIIDKYFPESELYEVPLDQEEQAMMDEAVALAKESDVAIMVLGGNEKTVREEYSRTNLDLCGRQEKLLQAVYATGKPVILLLVDGRAATINWAERYIPGIVHAWFPGEFMGDAVAQVLFGDYNPGGKLAVTFPRSVGQIPFAFPFKPGSDSKGFVRVTGTLYPFGYGLSYTTFAYSDLKIENPVIGVQGNVKLSCKVKNTGKVAGDEVVQLYLHDEMSSVTTYVKVLRGFERIHLEPGEEKVIDFVLTPQELGLWNKDNHFVVEPGTFAVMVGSSSQDIKLQGKFEVK